MIINIFVNPNSIRELFKLTKIGTIIRNGTLNEIDYNFIGVTRRKLITIVPYKKGGKIKNWINLYKHFTHSNPSFLNLNEKIGYTLRDEKLTL